MLEISKYASDALLYYAKDKWVKSVVFQAIRDHPDWAREVGLEVVQAACLKIWDLGNLYDLSSNEAFDSLLMQLIEDHCRLDNLTSYQHFALNRPKHSERLRLDRFLSDIRCGNIMQMVTFDLESDK